LGNADFYVVADNRGFWPLPERDSDGIPHYRATVIPFSETEYKNLLNNVSLITVKRGLGAFDIEITVEAGPGEAELRVPVNSGNRGSFQAVLVGCTPRALGNRAGRFEVVVDFVLTSSDVTPP
jgi:hypothetical protein